MSVKVGKYVGLVACVALFGYISTIPQLKCFYDATANKDRTITPNSQEILKQVDGGLTITSYVNLLDKFGYLGMPPKKAIRGLLEIIVFNTAEISASEGYFP